jgi:hypothetical protein
MAGLVPGHLPVSPPLCRNGKEMAGPTMAIMEKDP